MKTSTKLLFAGVLFAASSAPLVAAAAVNVDVNIGIPGYSSYAVPQPVYYPPAVYYAPAPRSYGYGYAHHRDWDRRWDRHERHDEHRRW